MLLIIKLTPCTCAGSFCFILCFLIMMLASSPKIKNFTFCSIRIFNIRFSKFYILPCIITPNFGVITVQHIKQIIPIILIDFNPFCSMTLVVSSNVQCSPLVPSTFFISETAFLARCSSKCGCRHSFFFTTD